MSTNRELTYTLDFLVGGNGHKRGRTVSASTAGAVGFERSSIPRIARLMALAIRFDALIRAGSIQDYAELARLGRVTRARITQIMKLLDLAPDIQEHILFSPQTEDLNERNLRSIVAMIDWNEQRILFRQFAQVSAPSLPTAAARSLDPDRRVQADFFDPNRSSEISSGRTPD